MMRRVGSVMVPLVLLVASTSAAQAPAPAEEVVDEVAMVERFEHAQELYRQGRFEEAAAELRALIAVRPEPVLYYNLGRAQDGNGDLAEAIESYERYLELDPSVEDRGAISGRIATLRAQLEERERLARESARPAPVPATPGPPPDAGSDAAIALPWVMVGVGAATLIAGAVLGGLSRSKRNEAGDATVHADAADALDAAKGLALGANVAFVAGGLMGAAGATWLVVDAATTAPPPDEVGLRVTFLF